MMKPMRGLACILVTAAALVTNHGESAGADDGEVCTPERYTTVVDGIMSDFDDIISDIEIIPPEIDDFITEELARASKYNNTHLRDVVFSDKYYLPYLIRKNIGEMKLMINIVKDDNNVVFDRIKNVFKLSRRVSYLESNLENYYEIHSNFITPEISRRIDTYSFTILLNISGLRIGFDDLLECTVGQYEWILRKP